MTDLAFYYWINGFPLSGHIADRSRFLGFIKTARYYRSKKYNSYDKFKAECLAYLDYLTDEQIKEFWSEKQQTEDFLDELTNAEMPLQIEHDEFNHKEKYMQRNIINHKLYETEITEDEFYRKGITVAEVKRRHSVES